MTNTTPVCWGSCGYNGTSFTGPHAEFGPALGDAQYAAGMSMSFDVFLEAEATLQLRLGNAHGVVLSTNNSYQLDSGPVQTGAGNFSAGARSPGRHCHSALPLAGIGCHPFGICTVILRSLLSVSFKYDECRPRQGAWHRVDLSSGGSWSSVAVDHVVLQNASSAPGTAPWELDTAFPNGGWDQGC